MREDAKHFNECNNNSDEAWENNLDTCRDTGTELRDTCT